MTMQICINCGLYKNDPDIDFEFCPGFGNEHWFTTEDELISEEFREEDAKRF